VEPACQWTIRGNTVASTQQVSTSLSVEETQALLQEVPKAYNTQINDVLLTALVQALLNGRAIALPVDLEGHGREEIFDDVDVSRTVGWFTTCFLNPENRGVASRRCLEGS